MSDPEMLAMLAEQAARMLAEQADAERRKALLDQDGAFDVDLWRQAGELGWPAAAIAEGAGGLGLGISALALLSEALGRRTVSLPLIEAAVIADAASASDDAASIVAALAAGESIGCIAFGEAGESGLPRHPALQLRDGKLSGSKAAVAFGAVADYVLCHAAVGDDVALMLVSLQQAGVNREIMPAIDNARAMANLTFEDVAAVRLDQGDGWPATLHAAAMAALATAYMQIGGTQACLEMAVEYAKERVVFGQPIGRFQAIKHKLADIYADLEIARGCAIDALDAMTNGNGDSLALAAMARLGAIRAYEFAARETIQTFGGIGVTWEAEPQHHYRRSRTLALELGAAPFWRDLVLDRSMATLEKAA